jgi:hypothetical protein
MEFIMIDKIYAGIGARQTPIALLPTMTSIAQQLAEQGWFLRSGHAKGADQAFADGAPSEKKQIHLPFNGYNNMRVGNPRYPHYIVPKMDKGVQEIARHHHPKWDTLSDVAKLFMCRNVTILLGEGCNSYADMVICWTPGGQTTGGTGHGIRIAYGFDIPVFNLALEEDKIRLNSFLERVQNG